MPRARAAEVPIARRLRMRHLGRQAADHDMKATLFVAITVASLATGALAQGTLVVNPVAVTNGLTGTLADSSLVAALYYGPAGAPEGSLLLLGPASALVNGYAEFGSQTAIPGFSARTSIEIGVRAWSLGYPTYEAALASGLSSVLADRSILSTAIIGGSPLPPPVPNPWSIPGFTVYPVPEVSASVQLLAGPVALMGLRCNPRRHGMTTTSRCS
jgi:hypothetical protein